MAFRPRRPDHEIAGRVPHDASVRVDERIKAILLRRESALRRARIAARRIKQP
jgi:hypothetical protein